MMRTLTAMLLSAVALTLLIVPTGCSPESSDTRFSSEAAAPQTTVISASWATEEVFSLDSQASAAELVVQGTVLSLGTVASDPESDAESEDRIIIYRDVTIRVEEVLKGGAVVGSTINARVLGGTIGGSTLVVEGEPEFEAGEKVVVFLTSRPDPLVPRGDDFQYSVVYGMHGKYRLEGANCVRSDAVPAPERTVSLDALKTATAETR